MFAERRERFLEKMEDGVAIVFAASEKIRSNDTEYNFRQDSYFHYLTGFGEPDAVAVFLPGHAQHRYVLFVRPRDPEKETWTGRRAGPEGAKERFGADAAFPIEQLPELLPTYLENAKNLYFAFGRNPEHDKKVNAAMAAVRAKVREGVKPPATLVDATVILNEMRLHKTPPELDLMRRAAAISREAHKEAMRAVRPGMREYELEAIIEYVFRRHGASAPGYGTIVGSGVNATILHYVENSAECRDGDLVLVDAGAEYAGYSGDITRTFPVNGKFTPAQREVYEVVLDAQLRGIDQVRPGRTFNEYHETAVRALVEGMVRLGILSGDVDTLIQEEAYKPYYMHRTGHWLGLDVHDVGEYRDHEQWRVLEPGMVLTVEPGLYFAEELTEVPEKYRGIGVRIEDDILVTEEGPENLTAGTPKTVKEVEAVMAEAPTLSAEPAPIG